MKEKLKSINNIPFLVCLGILLLNDFYLKAEYHNWITGKLSDFSGLFIFVSFWAAIFPSKKQIVYFSTALLFIIWKSPFSQSFIDLFSHHLYPIYRVVDLTDLISLVILPVAYHYKQEDFSRLKLNPIILGVLTIFSFCATSVPQPSQKFKQPQYLLFKDEIKDIEDSKYPSIYQVYKLDSLVIVNIKELRIEKRAALEDEYHKTQILEDLDLRFLRYLKNSYRLQGELDDYKELLDSLIVNESTSIILKMDLISDHLKFKKARLDGKYKRFDNNNLIIEGQYKEGIEDSIWTFYNDQNEVISKKHFVNGELIKNQLFENSKIKTEINFNKRSETVRNKYFLLAFLLLLIMGLLTKLYGNHKKSEQSDIIQTSTLSKVAFTFVLPITILVMAKLMSSLIPNSYSIFFFGVFGELILVYIFLVPLLLLVLNLIKLRNKFDLIYYILLFALSIVLIEECIYLNALIM